MITNVNIDTLPLHDAADGWFANKHWPRCETLNLRDRNQ